MLDTISIRQFLDDLAARTPTPGGGATAALTGALASSLASMVIAYSLNKKTLEKSQHSLQLAAAQLEELRARFLDLSTEDARAYEALRAALALDKADPARPDRLAAAARDATSAPTRAIEAADALLHLCEGLVVTSNPNLRSDLAIAAVLACAAAASSRWNIWINAPILDEASAGEGALALARANRLVADCRSRAHLIETLCA
jgi:formiminotetrahydrofolate cyclodeaminase